MRFDPAAVAELQDRMTDASVQTAGYSIANNDWVGMFDPESDPGITVIEVPGVPRMRLEPRVEEPVD